MGHQDIGRFPATRKWRDVISLISGGANIGDIAAATSDAAEASLKACGSDAAVRHAFYLLARIPLAARKPDFSGELRALGLKVGDAPGLMAVSAAMIQRIDRQPRSKRTDLSEMATLSAVESLQAVGGQALNDLFGTHTGSAQHTKEAIARLATVKQFGILARDFFARLLRRHLDYYLGREIPNHVGARQRFASVREHATFEEALDLHCREAAHIITHFAGEWHSKAEFEGGITLGKAGGFAFHAFDKLRRELNSRRERVA